MSNRNRTARGATISILALSLGWGLGCGSSEEAAAPAPVVEEAQTALPLACESHDPLRRAFFGELHLHTRNSFDANMWDVRGTPDDAYRFAKGEPLEIGPYAEDGSSSRVVQLERALDFAAVTDHGLYLGSVALCQDETSAVYASDGCRIFRGDLEAPGAGLGSFDKLVGITEAGVDPAAAFLKPGRSKAICGEGDARCLERMRTVWDDLQAAAERHNDASAACSFTTFHAYEYTATPGLAKVHRNVIFRNATVPDQIVSFIDEPTADGLWAKLKQSCLDTDDDCDVLAIPHNPNLSNGRMFTIDYRDAPLEEQVARASLRAELEPIVEITQIKGDSECKNGMYQVVGSDEFCDYEKIRSFFAEVEDCEEGTSYGALGGQGCQSRLDFVRYALIEGLREEERIGVNPFKLGFIASTDAHNANAGDVNEANYDGWSGTEDAGAVGRLAGTRGVAAGIPSITNNPGGLVGVWAEENSRNSLFDAMERRETFGTSGPRMTARFFGGFGLDPALCDDPEAVARGYAEGVAMGGDLSAAPGSVGGPSFFVSALRDPGGHAASGGLLQRVQVVKGWVGEDGQFHQQVVDVAGGANDAGVDLDSCTPHGPGHDALCGVWTDPEFDAGKRAVYYARVLENPSCRWSQWDCNRLPEDERPASCSDDRVPKTVQERLWTSPIWYGPPAA